MLTIKARNPFYANGPYYLWISGELDGVGRLDSFYLAAWDVPGREELSHLAIPMGKNKQGKQIYVQSIPDVLKKIKEGIAVAWPSVLNMLHNAPINPSTGRQDTVEVEIHPPWIFSNLPECRCHDLESDPQWEPL